MENNNITETVTVTEESVPVAPAAVVSGEQAPRNNPLMRRRAKFPGAKLAIYLVLSIWAVSTILPFAWVIMNSFKNKNLIRLEAFSLPVGDKFTFENYTTAWERVDLIGGFFRSIIISGIVVLLVLIFAGMASYALARFSFFGKKALNDLVVVSMMIPIYATIIPVFRMMHSWGIVNTGNTFLSLVTVILPATAGNLAFAIVILTSFIRTSVPIELEEAAYIEGYNLFQIFFKIVIPLSKSGLITVGIFSFLWSYNDLFTQMFFLRYRDTWSITRLLKEITSIAGTNYGLMCAAVVIVVIPVLVVYILMQKNIIKGLTAGAVKG